MSRAEAMIEAHNISRVFGRKTALHPLDLTLRRGESLTLFGPNGAGKSTLLKILATLLRPSSGTVTVAGYDLHEGACQLRSKIGVISHNIFLYDNLSPRENLRFYGRMYGVASLEQRIDELLERVGLVARQHDKIAGFSRGMQQRLSIARALVASPDVLLLDEPYTGLDQHAAMMLNNVLAEFHSADRTVILVTHNLQRGVENATRVAILVKGRIVFDQDRESLDIAHLDDLYNRYVGGGAA